MHLNILKPPIQVASLGNLLCGFSDAQWITLVTFDIFASTLVDHLAHLDCAVGEPVKEHLATLLLQVYFGLFLHNFHFTN